jgi:predicted esterase
MLLWLLACSSGATNLPSPLQDSSTGFFDAPWPSDTRTVDGRPDLSDWPERESYSLLIDFLDLAETLDGFGINSPSFIRFDSALDPTKLPSPSQSLKKTAHLFLIDIDPTSPNRGKRAPIEWEYNTEETHWEQENLLAVAPIWGRPLRSSTTYALVVSTALAQRSDEFADVWTREHPLYDYFLPLREVLFAEQFPIENVAIATVFTTQNAVRELAVISEWIESQLSMPALDQELDFIMRGGGCNIYEGDILLPLWQHGEKPYSGDGGHFSFDAYGQPIMHSWEKTRFRITVPNSPPPEDGWPVAVYSHGTGGDQSTFANSSDPFEPSSQLTRAGFMGIGISQPLHGDRGGDFNSELFSFNYLNPIAGRTMFRQGALDQVYLIDLLAKQSHAFTTLEGESFESDPSRIVYVGHSHGGEVGAMALPFIGDHLSSAVISGAGGGLSLSLMYREADDFDIEYLITTLLEFDEGEEMNRFHPALSLIQMTAEATDPLNYAPFWFKQEPWWDSSPTSVLQTEGLQDIYTPPIAIETLAAAAGSPIIGNVHAQITAMELYGNHGASEGVGNLQAYDGEDYTAGLVQFPEQGHFAIFDSLRAAELYREFLRSSIEDDLPYIE